MLPAGHFANTVVPVERCAVCHVEHNEPSHLIVRADQLCTDCHAEPARIVQWRWTHAFSERL